MWSCFTKISEDMQADGFAFVMHNKVNHPQRIVERPVPSATTLPATGCMQPGILGAIWLILECNLQKICRFLGYVNMTTGTLWAHLKKLQVKHVEVIEMWAGSFLPHSMYPCNLPALVYYSIITVCDWIQHAWQSAPTSFFFGTMTLLRRCSLAVETWMSLSCWAFCKHATLSLLFASMCHHSDVDCLKHLTPTSIMTASRVNQTLHGFSSNLWMPPIL